MINKYSHNERIKSYLQNKKYIKLTIDEGLNYLIPRWEKSINTFCNDDLIYDYINDLTKRRIIDEILNFLPEEEKKRVQKDLEPIDNIFKAKTFEVNECICGKKVEEKRGYNRKKHWYYYRITESIFNTEQKFTRKE
jgi:hypothetical protein